MTSRPPALAEPHLFAAARHAIDEFRWRSEVAVESIPSPQRVAPYSVAIAADVDIEDEEVGTGRLILLHDPAGNEAWAGAFRCVTFAKAHVDREMAIDPLIAEVGWSWLLESLENRGAEFSAPSGTVTAVSSRSFGAMSDDPDTAEVEIRASWTPHMQDAHSFSNHVAAWQDLLCLTSGLPPLPEGITVLGSKSGRMR